MLGAAALIRAHLAWWLWVNPANIAMRWDADKAIAPRAWTGVVL
jgi:hypothetical protein